MLRIQTCFHWKNLYLYNRLPPVFQLMQIVWAFARIQWMWFWVSVAMWRTTCCRELSMKLETSINSTFDRLEGNSKLKMHCCGLPQLIDRCYRKNKSSQDICWVCWKCPCGPWMSPTMIQHNSWTTATTQTTKDNYNVELNPSNGSYIRYRFFSPNFGNLTNPECQVSLTKHANLLGSMAGVNLGCNNSIERLLV